MQKTTTDYELLIAVIEALGFKPDVFHEQLPATTKAVEVLHDARLVTEVRVFNDAYWRGWVAHTAMADAEYDALALAADHGLAIQAGRVQLLIQQYNQLLKYDMAPSVMETRKQMALRHLDERMKL
jgi:hypothetical protein